jgi:hypothetical protein
MLGGLLQVGCMIVPTVDHVPDPDRPNTLSNFIIVVASDCFPKDTHLLHLLLSNYGEYVRDIRSRLL